MERKCKICKATYNTFSALQTRCPKCQAEHQSAKAAKPPKAIPKMSVKLKTELSKYSKLRLAFLIANPVCQVCKQRESTDVHHQKGRGKWLLIVRTWLAVCRICHTWIELNPDAAKKKGYSESRLS